MIRKDAEFRRKLFNFHLPVAQKTRWHHNESTPLIQATVLFQLQEERNHLERLAKAHIVSQDAAESHLQVLVHPRVAALLIRAQFRVQVLRQGNFGLAAPGIQLLLQPVGHIDGNLVALSCETRLQKFRRRGDEIFCSRFFIDRLGALRVAFDIFRGVHCSGSQSLLLFMFIETLLQKRKVVCGIFNVAVLVLEKSARIASKPQKLLGRHILVAKCHFPVKIQQVARRKRADAKAPLQLHLLLGARHFL